MQGGLHFGGRRANHPHMPEHAENSAPVAPRIIGRPFAKGTTGNAGGRSKMARDIQALAQEHGPAAIATLVEALKSRNERVCVAAAAILLDRGYGRVPQAITGADGNPVTLLHLFATRAVGEQVLTELMQHQSGTAFDGSAQLVNGDDGELIEVSPASLVDFGAPASE
jgi:hypothetical protein